MDVFGTIGKWAGGAWSALTSLGGIYSSATQALWSYVSSVYSGFSWVLKAIISPGYFEAYAAIQAIFNLIRDLRDALDRAALWIDNYLIKPVQQQLLIEIWVVRAELLVALAKLQQLVYILHIIEMSFTIAQVGIERNQRIADIKSARAYALALTTQLHQTIEKEAVAGYKAGQGIRTTLLQQLAADLNVRGILDKVATDALIKAIDVVVTIDDPVLGAVANRIIGQIIKKSGIGADLGDLIMRLIDPGAGGAAPKDLTGVITDITHRISQIEDWISRFMLDGGPEVEDAGRQWKELNSLVVDAALLAFFGQAVVAPAAWATEVSDTVGVVANGALGSIISLINRA